MPDMTEFKKKVIYTIDYNDFEDFVMSKYGGNFNFVAQQEADNYTSYDFSAPNMAMLFNTEADDIRDGKYKNHSVHQIFQVLLLDGHIEAGDYLIKVSW